MNDAAIEKEIQERGLTAPRITPNDIEAAIVHETYINAGEAALIYDPSFRRDGPLPDAAASLDLLTICILVLKNGFTVVGKSACASPENFDAELGRKIARDDAKRQIWALEGYQLRTKLAQAA